jgi:hypothetical protein
VRQTVLGQQIHQILLQFWRPKDNCLRSHCKIFFIRAFIRKEIGRLVHIRHDSFPRAITAVTSCDQGLFPYKPFVDNKTSEGPKARKQPEDAFIEAPRPSESFCAQTQTQMGLLLKGFRGNLVLTASVEFHICHGNMTLNTHNAPKKIQEDEFSCLHGFVPAFVRNS